MAEENINSTGPTVITDALRLPEAYPRPDGYSRGKPQYNPNWAINIPGANGHIGNSEILARSDHIHPLNYSKATPRPIGIPYGVEKAEESNKANFGLFGNIGIPYDSSNNQTNAVSNTYAMSNHVHAYGFCEPTSTSNSDKAYNLFPDGKKSTFQYLTLTNDGKVVPNWRGATISDYSADKFGNSGVATFPARLDHTHPLNCKELHDSNSTGDNVKDNIKPITFDPTKSTSGYGASYGSDHFYARTDHVHPFPTGGTGANGLTATNKTATVTQQYSKSNSRWITTKFSSTGNDYEWSCDNEKNTNGVVIPVCVDCRNSGQYNVAVFRKLHFSKHGLLKYISKESYAFNLTSNGWTSTNPPSV